MELNESNINYQFAQNWTFRAGYNAIAIADAALASRNFIENLDFLDIGPVLVHHDDDAVYHGPSFGVTWTR